MSEDSEDSSQEKSFDATETKIRKSREKGDTPQSTEANTLMLYVGMATAIVLAGGYSAMTVFSALTSLFTYPDNIGQDILLSRDGSVFKGIVAKTGLGILPVFALPFCFVLLSLILQRAVIFSPTKLKPKLSKISPISNAKQKYGGNGMVEFGKRFAKLIFITVISGIFFADAFFTLPSLAAMPAIMLIEEIKIVIVKLLFYMIGAMVVLTLIDLPYGQFAHLKKLRMTLQEIRDENKDSEGDPHMKSARRSRAMAISQGSMMKDVATADVIIVNPTHYAVALKWSRAPGSAPTCVAKGVDNIALQIRQKAGQHNVPIHSDPPCARSLYALVEIGEIIHPEHFAAVAAAIHFADQLKPKSY
jgi:flagellar biosynthetic protein FlhB